jgi:uncharacterized protein DUF2442
MPRLVYACWVREFVVFLRWSDGTSGEVDLRDELVGPVFEPLRDPQQFRRFQLNPELRTIVWPNGADLAPEWLYERTRVTI